MPGGRPTNMFVGQIGSMRSGGFAKDTTPFSEFLWAVFRRVKAKIIEQNEARSETRPSPFALQICPLETGKSRS
jgi:hypothetical protein